jgi:hypothetical protein
MSETVKKTLSELKAEALAAAKAKIEWAKDKVLGDQQAAQEQLAAANRMPEDPPRA